jgi:hypothetical protein
MPSRRPSRANGQHDLWVDTMQAVVGGRTQAHVQAAKRRRLSGASNAPLRWLGGRPQQRRPSERALAQRVRRQKLLAHNRLLGFMVVLIRLRVIVKVRLANASDCRRMMRVSHCLQQAGASRPQVALAILYDMAWRDPGKSRKLVDEFRRFRAQDGNVDRAWRAVQYVMSQCPRCAINAKYWKGPCAINCARMVHEWKQQDVVAVATAAAVPGKSLNTQDLMKQLASLSRISQYTGYAYLRVLEVVMGAKLKGDAEIASGMSLGVAALTRIVPLETARKHLRSRFGHQFDGLRPGDVAMVYCECAKALVRMGLLPEGFAADVHADLAAVFASKLAGILLELLEEATPLHLATVNKITCPRAGEAQDVDNHVTRIEQPWDHKPHFCKGSEMLVGEIRPFLQKRGWMVPWEFADQV